MYLRDIAIHADEAIVGQHPGGFVQKFHRDTCCVTELYLNLIYRKVTTIDDAKIQLIFTDLRKEASEKVFTLNCLCQFDFVTYKCCDVLGKKKLIIDTMQDALLWLAGKLDWQKEPFKEAYREAYRKNLMLEGFGKKTWVSPSSKYRVRIYFVFELEMVYLYGVLFENGGRKELGRIHLGAGPPEMGVLWDYIREGEWVSDTMFVLKSSSFLRQRWSADFSALMGE